MRILELKIAVGNHDLRKTQTINNCSIHTNKKLEGQTYWLKPAIAIFKTVKTLVEIVFACILLVILSPIFVLTTVGILLIDLNLPFFLQSRLGKQKKEFTIIKFRTMKEDKITLLGRVLRKTGIDELPQLLNIIAGQMSFVGPRPLTISDVKRLEWDTKYYSIRWNLKPGIVGLAQLSPICHKKISWFLDKSYVENHCFKLDSKILVSSVLIPLVGKAKIKSWIHKR